MISWLIRIGFAALLQSATTGPALAADVTAGASQAIERAVSELGESDFQVRERAAQYLWQQGPAAQAALERAARSADVEVRLQARRILEDFRYGILPSVPADILALIRQFRDGDEVQRQTVLQKLAARQRFDTLQRLLPLEEDPGVRRTLLVQLMESPSAVERFVAGTGLESLIALVAADQDGSWRRATLAQVLLTPAVLRRLAETGRLAELTKLIEAEEDPASRRDLLNKLFRNREAVAILLDSNQLEFVLQLVSTEAEKSHRAAWLCWLVDSSAAAAALTAGKRLETLWDYADRQLDSAGRDDLHARLFQAPATAAALLDRHGLRGAIAMAAAGPDAVRRGRKLAALMGSQAIRELLTDREYVPAALAVAAKEKDATARAEYLGAILKSFPAALFHNPGNGKAIWRLIRAESGGTWQADAVTQLLENNRLETVLETGEDARLLLRLARDEMTAEQRYRFLDQLLSDSVGLTVLLRHGQLAALVELARSVPADRRGPLLARLLACRVALHSLNATHQIGRLVSLAQGEQDAATRYGYLSELFRTPPAMWSLVEAGQFEALEALILHGLPPKGDGTLLPEQPATNLRPVPGLAPQDPASFSPIQRAMLFGEFVLAEAVAQELIQRKQESKLLDFAQRAPAPDARREYLQRLLASNSLASQLIAGGHFPALLALADQEADGPSQAALFRVLYANRVYVQHLAERQQLARLVTFLQQDDDGRARGNILQTLGQDATIVNGLVDAGQLEAILTMCAQEQPPADRATLLVALLSRPQVVRYFADRNQLDHYLDWLRQARDADESGQILRSFQTRPEALVPLVARGRFEDFWSLFDREAYESDRNYLVVAMLSEPEPVRQLTAARQLPRLVKWIGAEPQLAVRRAMLDRQDFLLDVQPALNEAGLIAEVVAWIKAEPDSSLRASAVRDVLYSPRLWQMLLRGGQPDLLDELVALESDPEARQFVRRHTVFTASGRVADHVERGEPAQALQLLESCADYDQGRLHLATFLLATGQIEPRMAEVRRRVEQQDPPAGDARLLVYLARACGDLPTARRAAERAGDPGLLKAVLVEQHAWAEAAALQAAGPCPLPIPAFENVTLRKNWLRAEQLNQLAAYQRLAGADQDFHQTVVKLQELAGANPNDVELQWLCGVGLILNERWDEGLVLVAGAHPTRAFDRLCHRRQYRQALELAGWKTGTAADRRWLDALPIVKSSHREPAEQRFMYALRVATLLYRLGDRQAANQIFSLLVAYAREERGMCVEPPFGEQWLDMLARLMELGETERSWELAIGASRYSTSAEPLLTRIHDGRSFEARAWWELLCLCRPGEPERFTFRRAQEMLDGPPAQDAGEFARRVAAAERHIRALTDYLQDDAWLAVAAAYRRSGRPEDELRCLKAACPWPNATDEARMQLAEALGRSGRWTEAAEQYERIWREDHERVGALYLSGHAWERAGRADEGRRRKELARQVTLYSQTHFDLAGWLFRHGLQTEALDQCRLALRTLPIDSPDRAAAADGLVRQLAGEQPAEAADWLQFVLLNDLRWEPYLERDYEFLHAPAVIHRLRAVAAVRAGDFERAEREIDLTLAAAPADAQLAADLVPLLDQAGRKPQADRLFERVSGALSEPLPQFPQAAMVHHDLAWLSVRCRRRLEQAVHHARQAVELDPHTAAYRETLTEIMALHGDRTAALIDASLGGARIQIGLRVLVGNGSRHAALCNVHVPSEGEPLWPSDLLPVPRAPAASAW